MRPYGPTIKFNLWREPHWDGIGDPKVRTKNRRKARTEVRLLVKQGLDDMREVPWYDCPVEFAREMSCPWCPVCEEEDTAWPSLNASPPGP